MNWFQAPAWARYHAVDQNGEGWFYEFTPYKDNEGWYEDTGKFLFNELFDSPNWEESLTKRPEKMKYIYQRSNGKCVASDIEPRSVQISDNDWKVVKAIVWAATTDSTFNKVAAIKAIRLFMEQRSENQFFNLLHAKQLVEAAYNEQ